MAEEDLIAYRRHQEQQAEKQGEARDLLASARGHGNESGGNR